MAKVYKNRSKKSYRINTRKKIVNISGESLSPTDSMLEKAREILDIGLFSQNNELEDNNLVAN